MPYDPARHGPQRIVAPGFHAVVFAVIRRVPAGAVTTYGDIAEVLGRRGLARQVGWALAALPAIAEVPWWRVVGAGGRLPRAGTAAAHRHAARLRRDGVAVRADRVLEFERRRMVPRG